MEIRMIITTRGYETWPSADIMFEWEDVFSTSFGIPLYKENKFVNRIPFLSSMLQTNTNAFRFDMSPLRKYSTNNKKNIVPCIIDFYIKNKEHLDKFYLNYSKNKVVFISSKEVYDYLKSLNCPLNIRHLPLSISDKYKIKSTNQYDKCYDLVMMGRQNPVLLNFVERYEKKHAGFRYVYRKQNGGFFYYYTSDGQFLGDINTREKYISLMQKSRIGLYSTPGIDGGEIRTNGFNQVTPRFLELLSCGCHVLARYPSNADTEFYELNKFSPNIEDYSTFEKEMDRCLSSDVDMKFYSEYLSKHYTSVRCKQMQQYLNEI